MSIFEIENIWIFLLILPFVAFMYSSVGHGGASGYLALMALFGFSHLIMKPTALLLNIFVAAIAFYHYWRSGYFNKRLFLAFAITSIPLAYWGGTIELDASLYKKVLAVLLIFAILRMMNVVSKKGKKIQEANFIVAAMVGAAIGFFSGLIGIGGGIILSPIILLLNWGNVKQAAAVSALFIWVNSLAAFIGQLKIGVQIEVQSFILVGIAIVGGLLGGYYGSKKFSNVTLRFVLAFVLVLASVKLLIV